MLAPNLARYQLARWAENTAKFKLKLSNSQVLAKFFPSTLSTLSFCCFHYAGTQNLLHPKISLPFFLGIHQYNPYWWLQELSNDIHCHLSDQYATLSLPTLHLKRDLTFDKERSWEASLPFQIKFPYLEITPFPPTLTQTPPPLT